MIRFGQINNLPQIPEGSNAFFVTGFGPQSAFLPAETWLTVYRPLDILKLRGYPMGCWGQRLSMHLDHQNAESKFM